jgi:hypothetical protein
MFLSVCAEHYLIKAGDEIEEKLKKLKLIEEQLAEKVCLRCSP